MINAFLLTTALAASVDSFICGFTVTLAGGRKKPLLVGVTLILAAMCLAANYLGKFLSGVLSDKVAAAGGFVLIGVGIYDLISALTGKRRPKEEKTPAKSKWKQSLLLGLALGPDGAFADLSISIAGNNSVFVPLVFTGMHLILLSLGIALARTRAARLIGRASPIAPLVLIGLGISKILILF